jgi:anti-anti-sigma factor
LAGLGWDGHLLLLHGSESERLSGLVAWVRHGLERDEKVIYTEAATELSERSMSVVLQQHGIDVAAATARGRLTRLPLARFYPPGGQAEIVERALAEGFRAVRMVSEASAVLAVVPEGAHTAIERGTDELCRTHPVSALCQYDEAATTGARLCQITAVHADGVRQRQLGTAPTTGGLALAGEVDMSNDALLTSALAAATGRADGTLRLDLSRVRFLGAGGCRALVQAVQEFRERGGTLLLVAPQPQVEQILRIVGLDRLAHIERTEGQR